MNKFHKMHQTYYEELFDNISINRYIELFYSS